MGGLIAARYAQRYGDSLTAVVLSGPLVGEWGAAGQLLALPDIPDVPLDITTLSRDSKVGEDYDNDPLVWHGPFKRPTLEAINAGLAAIEDGPSLASLPLMWAHGEADQLVPLAGSRSGIEHLRGEHFVERIYPERPSRDLQRDQQGRGARGCDRLHPRGAGAASLVRRKTPAEVHIALNPSSSGDATTAI